MNCLMLLKCLLKRQKTLLYAKALEKTFKLISITEKGKNNTVTGRAENYKPIVIREKAEMGKITPVIITDAAPTYLFGRLI